MRLGAFEILGRGSRPFLEIFYRTALAIVGSQRGVSGPSPTLLPGKPVSRTAIIVFFGLEDLSCSGTEEKVSFLSTRVTFCVRTGQDDWDAEEHSPGPSSPRLVGISH